MQEEFKYIVGYGYPTEKFMIETKTVAAFVTLRAAKAYAEVRDVDALGNYWFYVDSPEEGRYILGKDRHSRKTCWYAPGETPYMEIYGYSVYAHDTRMDDEEDYYLDDEEQFVLSDQKAKELQDYYRNQGYDDISIEEYEGEDVCKRFWNHERFITGDTLTKHKPMRM